MADEPMAGGGFSIATPPFTKWQITNETIALAIVRTTDGTVTFDWPGIEKAAKEEGQTLLKAISLALIAARASAPGNPGEVATSSDGGVESGHATASGSGPLPSTLSNGDACSALEPPLVTNTVGRQQELKRAAGVTPGPSEAPSPATQPQPDSKDVREALDSIDSQLDEMRSLKGWRLNLIRENMAKLRAALTARVDAPAAPPEDAVREALADLVFAVGNMKLPQTVADVALMMTVTLGPAYDRAKRAIAALPPDAGSRK